MFEDGTTGFFLLDSVFFFLFSLLRGLLSPMATFSLLLSGLDAVEILPILYAGLNLRT